MFVAIDYETALLSGNASIEYQRPDFRVISMALSWYATDGTGLQNQFFQGEDACRLALESVLNAQIIVHNVQFEYGVTKYRFPDLADKINWHADTVRLGLVFDHGGLEADIRIEKTVDELLSEFEENGPTSNRFGLSLNAMRARILPGTPDHKKRAYNWLEKNKGIKKKHGAHLNLLPPDELKIYNVADTDITLKLFTKLTKYFDRIGYNWKPDHSLHLSSAKEISIGKGLGVRVDRPAITDYREDVEKEVITIDDKFHKMFEKEIADIEDDRREAWIDTPKTQRGKDARRARVYDESEKWYFNTNSNLQLAVLFMEKLGRECPKWTKKKRASFKSSVLPGWGPGGEVLLIRRKRLLVQKQCEALLNLTSPEFSPDGRWHQDLKAAGPATGRFAGGGNPVFRLNVQGLARRDKRLMSAILADEGCVTVSCDLGSGEPTCTAHFSGDETYKYATLNGKGKAPFWTIKNGKSVLMIDSIYLMLSSVNPLSRDAMLEAWNMPWPAGTFAEQWLTDPEVIKKHKPLLYAFNKICVLGLGYGLGWKNLIEQAADNGFKILPAQSRELHSDYWFTLFPQLKRLVDERAHTRKVKGQLINPFGYRIVGPPRKAFNYFIQSTVSGIMHIILMIFRKKAPYVKFRTVIHDELLFDCPKDLLEKCRRSMEETEVEVNNMLNWTTDIRIGWVTGENWYEAK